METPVQQTMSRADGAKSGFLNVELRQPELERVWVGQVTRVGNNGREGPVGPPYPPHWPYLPYLPLHQNDTLKPNR